MRIYFAVLALMLPACNEFNRPVAPLYPCCDYACVELPRGELCGHGYDDKVEIRAYDLDYWSLKHSGIEVYLRVNVDHTEKPLTFLGDSTATHVYRALLRDDDDGYYLKVTLEFLSDGTIDTTNYIGIVRVKNYGSFELRLDPSLRELGYPENLVWQVRMIDGNDTVYVPERPHMQVFERTKMYSPWFRFANSPQYVGTPFAALQPGDTFAHHVEGYFQNSDDSPPLKFLRWKTNHDTTWTDSSNSLRFLWHGVVPSGGKKDTTYLEVEAFNEFGYSSRIERSEAVWGLSQPLMFRDIPAGDAIIGDTAEGDCRTEVDSFSIMATEVTMELYAMVIEPGWSPRSDPPNLKTRPVTSVNWFEAVVFCNELSRIAGFDTCYAWSHVYHDYGIPVGFRGFHFNRAANGYRLPTAAEWEYACRAGTESAYWWGEYANTDSMSRYAWYIGNSGYEIHPVAQKKPNPFGLYDMIGNAYEWCHDWYSDDYPYSTCLFRFGPYSGTHREIRGGAYKNDFGELEPFARNGLEPGEQSKIVGFRCVRRE